MFRSPLALTAIPLAAAFALAGCSSGSSTSSPVAAAAGTGTAAAAASSSSSSSSSSPSSSPTSSGGDPCSLVTAAQIQSVFGGTVADGVKDTDPDVSGPTCKWQVTGSNLGSDGEIVVAFPSGLQSSTKFGYAKAGLPNAVDIPGIGDDAIYQANTAALQALKGEKVTLIQGVFAVGSSAKPDPAKIKSEITALGAIVVRNV